jgi:hypothetical protein
MRFFLGQLLFLLVVGSTFAAPIPDSRSGDILLYKRDSNGEHAPLLTGNDQTAARNLVVARANPGSISLNKRDNPVKRLGRWIKGGIDKLRGKHDTAVSI